MPRFYFNLFNHITSIDEEGVDLADVAAAKSQAWTAAAQLIADGLIQGRRIDLSHRIEVEDEERRLVYSLPFAELVEADSLP